MDEETAAKSYTEGKPEEDAKVYFNNFKAHKKGISKEEMVNIYTEWGKDGSYDNDMNPDHYRGPIIGAEALAEYIEREKRSSVKILDVAAGSGFLGVELAKCGFTNIDALDPSEGMLQLAEKKKVYQNCICKYFDNDTDVPDDSYDVLIIAGGMGEGHIPGNSIVKMQKIVKKGGLILIVMRKEYLNYVEDYKNLLSLIKKMEADGKWDILAEKIVEGYSFNKQGLVFVFKVLK